jgi:hypothetical protein
MSVYFMQCGGPEGPIKIGWAANPEKRKRELQTGAPGPLNILHTIPGGVRQERALHELLKEARLHGEWFSAKPVLALLEEKRKLFAEAETEIDWRCDSCRGVVENGTGYIHIAYPDVFRRREERENWDREHDQTVVNARDLWNSDKPPLVKWQVHHRRCDPNSNAGDYWFGIERCRTWKMLNGWTAHLLEKSWLSSTNWREFIVSMPSAHDWDIGGMS